MNVLVISALTYRNAIITNIVHPRLSEPFVQTKNIFIQISENLDTVYAQTNAGAFTS